MVLDAADGACTEAALILVEAMAGPKMHDVICWLAFQ